MSDEDDEGIERVRILGWREGVKGLGGIILRGEDFEFCNSL